MQTDAAADPAPTPQPPYPTNPAPTSPRARPSLTALTEEAAWASANYLKKLLGKHVERAELVQSFTEDKAELFELQILQGRYDIRERDWSGEVESGKNSRLDARKSHDDPLASRKQLQDQLQLIEDTLQDSQTRLPKPLPEEQRLAFLRKMQKQRKQLQRKRAETAKLQQQQRAEQQRQEREQRQKDQTERKLKKRQEAETRMKQLQELHRKKEEDFKSQTLLLKEKMREKTMVDKMEEHFNQKQNESLEERKKRLAEIRALHRPIDRAELDAHALKLQQLQAQRLALAAQSEPPKEPAKAFYKSVFYQKIKEQQKIHTERKEEQELGKLKEARDRLKKYAENIRTNHKPSIDQKKVEELKFRSVSHKNRSMSSVQKSETPGKIGLRYLEYSKTQIDHTRLLGPATPSEPESDSKQKKLDYLSQLREKNKNRAAQSAQDMLKKLQKDNLPRQQKTKKILEFTQRLQQKAKRRQQLQKLGVNSAVDEELDMLYLQAIEAKLNLLDDN